MRSGVTTFAGVPYTYEQLQRVGFERVGESKIKYLTQAGGAIGTKFINEILLKSVQYGFEFYVMYGQTEATARITILEPRFLPTKIGSVGKVIPDGNIMIMGTDGKAQTEPNMVGKLMYTGPNVCLGYANTRDDLILEDQWQGTLDTGDFGSIDADGFVRIERRHSRFAKIRGIRVSLDDIEEILSPREDVFAVVEKFDKICIVHEGESKYLGTDVEHLKDVAQGVGLRVSDFRLYKVPNLPRLSSGKKDYRTMEDLIEERR